MFGTQITALGYADDIVLVAEKPEKLQGLVKICEEWSKQNGMKFQVETLFFLWPVSRETARNCLNVFCFFATKNETGCGFMYETG